jgi:hypothetical protein
VADGTAIASIIVSGFVGVAGVASGVVSARGARKQTERMAWDQRRQERRENLYVDILEAVRRMERKAEESWFTSEGLNLPLLPVEELDRLEARVAAFGSREVKGLFEEWYEQVIQFRGNAAQAGKRRVEEFPEGSSDISELTARLKPEIEAARETRSRLKSLRERLEGSMAEELDPRQRSPVPSP